MELALKQAEKVIGNTKDNPAVGCVITKNNQMISAGHTSINGRPQAETNAINFSTNDIKNATLYVTLEPCSHHGKTPPCVNLIIKKKIKKVFFSVFDPDTRSFNKSLNKFKKSQITTNRGLFKKEIKNFYRSYIKYKNDGLPFVTCKLAVTKDFYTINKRHKNITNKYSRGRVQLMRSYHDCIVTSSQTVLKDNPKLTCRIDGLKYRSPVRIILDSKLKIKMNTHIIKEGKKHFTIIFYNKINKMKLNLLKKLKIKVIKISLDEFGNLDLKEVLINLKKLGFSRVFLESGIKLTSSFFKNNLVDDFKLFISDNNIGKLGMGNIKNFLNLHLKNIKKETEKVNLLGDNLISYKLK